ANRRALSMCLWLILIGAPAQAVIGDFHGLNTMEHQPIKIAAMEGNWETTRGMPLLLFAIPDQEAERNHMEVGIPRLGSLILTHDWDGEVLGLKEVAPEERPPVWIVFWAFRIMVGIGMLMIGCALVGLLLRRGGRYWQQPVFLNVLRLMAFTPFVAVLCGWVVTEVGRFPWVVYGQMSHSEGLTPSLTGGMVLFTLIGYVLVYAVIFSAGIYYLMRVLRAGIESIDWPEEVNDIERPKRPLSASQVSIEEGGHGYARHFLDHHLGDHTRLMHYDVRAKGWLRSGGGYPVSLRAGRRRTGRDDELRGTGMGWQRGLADPRWRRTAGGLPAGLLGLAAGPLHRCVPDAGRAHLPWRGLRVPLQGRALAQPVELGLCRGIHGGGLCPGCGGRCLYRRLQ